MLENIEAALEGNINNKKTYSEYGRDLYQVEIDTHFQYANNYYEIEMETSNGTNNYLTIGVRIDRGTNVNTGVKLSDDYKKLIFQKNLGVVLGRKFSFEDNIWLTTDNSTLLTNSSSCMVRRCNNVLRYKLGNVYDSEPCVIDYTSSNNSLDVKTEIIIPGKNIKVYIQYNEVTKKIKINQRFIFGSQVFKVIAFEDYNRLQTENKNVGLMTIIMELDNISDLDDFVNDIAAEGLTIEEVLQSDENIINEGNNSQDIIVPAESALNQNLESLIITPEDFEIRETKTKEYSLFYGDNDITNLIEYNIITGGNLISPNNYIIKRENNKFLITCVHKAYGTPLEICFKYLGNEKVVKFYLRGLF